VVKDFDANQSCCYNEGGGGSSGLCVVGDEEGGIGSRDDETDDENAADIKDQDTPEGPSYGDRDVLPGILSLADGDTNEFGSHVGKESVDESGPETKEGGQTLPVGNPILEELAHGAMWRIPVTETTAEEKRETQSETGNQTGILTFGRV